MAHHFFIQDPSEFLGENSSDLVTVYVKPSSKISNKRQFLGLYPCAHPFVSCISALDQKLQQEQPQLLSAPWPAPLTLQGASRAQEEREDVVKSCHSRSLTPLWCSMFKNQEMLFQFPLFEHNLQFQKICLHLPASLKLCQQPLPSFFLMMRHSVVPLLK